MMRTTGFKPCYWRLLSYALMISCFILVSACRSIPKKTDNACDLNQAVRLSDFKLSGKLALSDGQEGGSGRLRWQQQNNHVLAQFKAPMGQGDWLIEESDRGGRLVVNNEPPLFEADAALLVADAVGWSVPWHALKKWLLAQPLNQNQATISYTNTTKTIQEQGWTLVYDRFQAYPVGCLPHRIMASKSPYSLRLVIREWQW